MSFLTSLLKKMKDINASDLHIRVGREPVYRMHSKLVPVNTSKLTHDALDEMLKEILSEKEYDVFKSTREMDSSFGLPDLGRFRVNCFYQRGTPAIAFRQIMSKVPDFESLHLPPVIQKLAESDRGIVLVTGTTGSGKSTTLASMIEYVNRMFSKNIITIEDPVEYLYKDNKCIISQREVGTDTSSYQIALKQALRQDPDVILIGEIRDADTMMLALQAADTGHLVLTTLHTLNATETISRIISFFPPHQHQQIRLLLSNTLSGVVSQRLLEKADGKGVTPAVEIMISTQTIKDYLVDPEKTNMIEDAIREGRKQYQSQSFDQHILDLYQEGQIEYEVAKSNVNNPEDFDLKLRGVEDASSRLW